MKEIGSPGSTWSSQTGNPSNTEDREITCESGFGTKTSYSEAPGIDSAGAGFSGSPITRD